MQGLPKIGDVLDDTYEIQELIGTGGFGAVYRARQISMERDVALKVLVAHAMKVDEMIERFRREVMAVRNLGHPNTIRIFDFRDRPDGLLYYAMEYVKGPTLKDVIKEGPLSPARTRRILRQVAKSLAEAHSFGIVHRDLKPANVMLADIPGETDFVKVVDFGIAKIVGGDDEEEREQLTSAGVLVGTLNYMSPEQIAGGQLGPESDLYALGLIGIEMLMGKSVFAGTGRWEILHKQISDEPVEIPQPVLDTALGPIFEQALQKRPTERFRTAEEVIEALGQLSSLASDPVVEAPELDEDEESDEASAPRSEQLFAESSQPSGQFAAESSQPSGQFAAESSAPQEFTSEASQPSGQFFAESSSPSRAEARRSTSPGAEIPAEPVPEPVRSTDGRGGSGQLRVGPPAGPSAPADETLPEPDPFEDAQTAVHDSGVNANPLGPNREGSGVSELPPVTTPTDALAEPPEPDEEPESARPTENSYPAITPAPARTSLGDENTSPGADSAPEPAPPRARLDSTPGQRTTNAATGTMISTEPDSSSNKGLIMVAVAILGLVLLLGGVALYVGSQKRDAEPEEAKQAVVTPPEEPAKQVDPVAEPLEPVEQPEEVAAPEEAADPEEPEEPAVEMKTIRLVTPGVQAQVYEETELLGETPLRFPVGAPAKYTLTAEGYEEASIELSNESDAEVKIDMERVGGKSSGGTKSRPSGSDDGWIDVPVDSKKSPKKKSPKKKSPKKKKKDDGVPLF